MKIIDYELTCDSSCLFEKNIFIYGTGKYAYKTAAILLQMEVEINGFCETSLTKNEFLGKSVCSVETLIKKYDKNNVLVIIASEKYYKDMINELQKTKNMILCTYYALVVSLYLNYEKKGIGKAIKTNMEFYKKISLNMAVQSFFDPWRISRGYCDMLCQPTVLLLYQPGKVASNSIHISSQPYACSVHSLAYAFNADDEMRDTYNQMLNRIKENPVKIITGVREPISRDISAFFQGTDIDIWPFIRYDSPLYLYGDYSRYNTFKSDTTSLKNKICVFERNLNYSFEHMQKEIVENESDIFSWFDYEIKALFGVDIYEYPFDKEKGYSIIEHDNVQILIYKCEKLYQLEKVLAEFLKIPDFRLEKSNQGEEKIYAYVYKKFKEEVKLNLQYFDYYYTNNLKLKHFYTDFEIEYFKEKWKKKVV